MYPLPSAGPRPAPLPWASRLVALAWTQLAVLVLASGYVGLALALIGPARVTVVVVANLQLLAVHGGVAALVLARRRAPLIGVASVSALAWGAEALLWYAFA
jgi:small-conductance mechanosensitive channel